MCGTADASAADPLERARRLRAEAQQLLGGEGLLSLTEAVGPAVESGSVALDPMSRPDFDLEIRLPSDAPVDGRGPRCGPAERGKRSGRGQALGRGPGGAPHRGRLGLRE
jgi:hypothetical protein